MKKRLLASLLSLCLIVGLLPTAALAADESGTEGETPAVCTCTALCAEGSVDATCPVCAEDYNSCAYEEAPAEPAEEPGVEPVEAPTEGPAGEPNPCALTEGCTLENGHEGACVLADEPQEPVGPTMEEQLAELIAALPDPADIDPLNEEQVAAVNGQISEIYAFAEENGLDVENDETINAVIAALYPVELLADKEGTQENPWDISVEGAENHVIAYLEKNSGDQSTPTYTLVISGSGAMAAFHSKNNPQPWETYNEQITTVEIASGVTSIGQSAFSGLSVLTQVSIPETITEIQEYAFNECVALTTISIPASLTNLNNKNPFRCSGITNFVVADENSKYLSEDGILYEKTDDSTLKLVAAPTASGNFTIPSSVDGMSVTSLGNQAFFGNLALNGIVIPDSITSGGGYEFSQCTNLTSVTLSENLTTIPARMFYNAPLTSITIPKNVTIISDNSFGCDAGKGKLTDVKILGNLSSLHNNGFRNQSIKTLTFGSDVTSIVSNQFGRWPALSTVKFEGSNAVTIKEFAFFDNRTNGATQAPITGMDMSSLTSITFNKTNDDDGKARAFNGWQKNSAIYVGSDTVAQTIMKDSTAEDVNKHQISTDKTFVVVVNGGSVDLTKGGFDAVTKDDYIAQWYESSDFAGTAVTTPQSGKTYYAKWIELTSDDITMEYGSEKALSEIKIDGVALTGWTSADPDVVKIENGKMIATGVGDTTITANAALATRSGETLTVKVKVNPMPITFGKEDGENPNGTITYQFTGEAPDFAQFAKFYQAVKGQDGKYAAGEKAITLTEGTDIVFEYDAGGGKNDYHYLPIDVTENQTYGIEVIVKLVNPNYRFVTESNQTLSETIKENVVVKSGNLKEVSFEGVPAAGETMTYPYNGQPQPPVSNLTRMSAGSIKNFTIHFHPWGDTEFNEAHLENQTVDQLTPEAIRAIAPTEPGSYLMIVDGVSDSEYAYRSWIFTITKATVTIRPNDKSAYVGDELPTLGADDYTVTGLVDGEPLTKAPTLAYASTPDMSKAGTYAIKASGAEVPDADRYNSEIVYQDGTLTVSRRSSGGGGGSSSGNTTTETEKNPDGSTTTTVTDKKTGTVTETTKFKDGSTLVVETKKDGTVTTTETAKNGVKVRTVDEPGEDVTAKVTIPKSVGEAVVTIPADVDYGMVAVDADTGEVVKLSVPTREGMTVKLDGSADLVLMDRGRDFTDTRGHWAEDAIDFATAHELFSGTSDTTFTPDSPMTRAMLMTVLARFDGQDTTGGAVWYEKAMAWARENGISDGSNPNGSITREQLATMLWRYAGSPAGDGSAIGRFTDSGKVSSYAVEAMNWAVGTGLFGGMGDGTLAPQGSATRAQVATILMRFVENLTK